MNKFKCPHCNTELDTNVSLFPCTPTVGTIIGKEDPEPVCYMAFRRDRSPLGRYTQPSNIAITPMVYFCRECGYVEQHIDPDAIKQLDEFSDTDVAYYVPSIGDWMHTHALRREEFTVRVGDRSET